MPSSAWPVVVSLSGTDALAGDTLIIHWGARSEAYTLTGADIIAGSVTVTVGSTTIADQGDGTFDVAAELTNPAGYASGNSSAFPVTVSTVTPGLRLAWMF